MRPFHDKKNNDDDAENVVILYLENLCVVHIHISLHFHFITGLQRHDTEYKNEVFKMQNVKSDYH